MKRIIVQQGNHSFKIGPQSVNISLSDHSKSNFVKSMFLPKNYPNSVSDDYMKFTTFQFVQSVTGTIAGTISTQAMLHALGLGAGASMGMAATTNWIIKDGFGLLGGVIYAGLMGSKFDASPKVFCNLGFYILEVPFLGCTFYSRCHFCGDFNSILSKLFCVDGINCKYWEKYWMASFWCNTGCNSQGIYKG